MSGATTVSCCWSPAVLWQFSKLNDLKSIQDQHLRVALDALGSLVRRRTSLRLGSI